MFHMSPNKMPNRNESSSLSHRIELLFINCRRYPSVSCEILCSDVWSIYEVIFENVRKILALQPLIVVQEELVSNLLAFFDKEGPIDPSTASHVCKVLGALLQRKTPEVRVFSFRSFLSESV